LSLVQRSRHILQNIKIMSTFNDIRTRFEVLLKENARTIEGLVLPSLEKILGKGRINTKNGGKDLRFDLGGDEKKSIAMIMDALNKIGLSSVEIKAVGPGDYANGGNSGKFTTYIVTFTTDSKISSLKISKGDIIKFVDNKPPMGSIKSKELSPSSLGIPGDTEMNSNSLKSAVHSSINRNYGKSNLFMQSFLTELYDLIASHVPSVKFNSLMELTTFNETIKYDENIKEAIDVLGNADLNTIGKDFGEVLGAALMLNVVKTSHGISFPSGNNPLVDFHIDGYGISSKYKAGAAPTLSNIIKDLNSDNFTEDSEVKLYALFKIIETNNVVDGYIKGAEFMELTSVSKLKELIGNVTLDSKSLEDFIQAKIGELGEEEFYNKYVGPIVDVAGRGSKKYSDVPWDKLKAGKKYIGLFSYPLSLQLIDKLNGKLGDGNLYIDTLQKIVSKLEVKQLYMDVLLKTEEINFYLKGFGDSNAKLSYEAPNVSTPNPGNGKLGFKMK
jgi:hypothetical protein